MIFSRFNMSDSLMNGSLHFHPTFHPSPARLSGNLSLRMYHLVHNGRSSVQPFPILTYWYYGI
jgi:hypothetical protein